MIPESYIWIVVVGFIIAFVLAFGIGANDVANSFGTSVGSKVLTLRQAFIIATFCETAGALLMGVKVSDTVRKGVMKMDALNGTRNSTNDVEIILCGQLASLTGACIWLLIATALKLPVSGSHSIVGAVLGFILVAFGHKAVNWFKIGMIAASWFISPLLSGIVSVFLFFLFDVFILKKVDPIEPGLKFLPFIFAIAVFINVFSILMSGPDLLKFNVVPIWGKFILAFGIGIIVLLLVQFVLNPFLRRKLNKKFGSQFSNNAQSIHEHDPENVINLTESQNAAESGSNKTPQNAIKSQEEVIDESSNSPQNNVDPYPDRSTNSIIARSNPDVISPNKSVVKDKPQQDYIFGTIQILAAIFSAFAHGGNDVSNAIGPLIAIWVISVTQDIATKSQTPLWILFYGSVGMIVGLWSLGAKVIKTIGEDLTKITPSSGVTIELGAAMTVVTASNVGLPISTTHCKVGSVICVGRYRCKDNVNWKLFGGVAIAWLVTVPISGLISALATFSLMKIRGF